MQNAIKLCQRKKMYRCTFKLLSQVSFWIDSESTPARISLGITTVLAMTTLMFGVQSSLPKVPYVKSVDVYMIMSFTLVFASLAEYAAVNFQKMKKRENQHNKRQAELVDHVSNNDQASLII